jgi:alpha-tubulin suppressor-like RCC1 family protein
MTIDRTTAVNNETAAAVITKPQRDRPNKGLCICVRIAFNLSELVIVNYDGKNALRPGRNRNKETIRVANASSWVKDFAAARREFTAPVAMR